MKSIFETKWGKSIIASIAIIIVACVGSIMLAKYHVEDINIQAGGDEVKTKVAISISEPEKPLNIIKVDVKGAVKNPGVIALEEGKRVDDVLKKAGGALETADLNKVNLAAPLMDGQVIYIPKEGEIITSDLYINQSSGKININTADKQMLQKLPRVGEKIAERIIEYRNENGMFERIEDIINVSGIGETTFEDMKDLITLY